MPCNYHCVLGHAAATTGLGKKGVALNKFAFVTFLLVNCTDPNQAVLVSLMENTPQMMVPGMKLLKNNSSEKLNIGQDF